MGVHRDAAFAGFVVEHGDALARLAGALCGDRHEAEDVVADTLMLVWQKWTQVAAARDPGAYTRRMLINTFLGSRRRRRPRTVELTDAMGAVADPTATVDRTDEISQELDRLPVKERAALVLRYFLDLTTEQIAAELSCSPAAARTYLSRGRANVAAGLAAQREVSS